MTVYESVSIEIDITVSCFLFLLLGTCVAAKRCLESHLKAKRSREISREIVQNPQCVCAVEIIRGAREGSPQRKTIHRSIFHQWISALPWKTSCLETTGLAVRVCRSWRQFRANNALAIRVASWTLRLIAVAWRELVGC